MFVAMVYNTEALLIVAEGAGVVCITLAYVNCVVVSAFPPLDVVLGFVAAGVSLEVRADTENPPRAVHWPLRPGAYAR